MNYINLVALGMFVLIGTFIAILSRRMGVKSASDYYVAGGRMGALLATGTYAATTYSAFMMIGLVGLTFQTGIGALGFELIYLVATVFMLSTLG
ncbi:MAG: sodium:solute symporter family protein, partial [Thermosphaera sp.]